MPWVFCYIYKKSPLMLQCLTNIIGITQSDCQCIIAGIDPDVLTSMKISTSGIYMDDLPGGVHLKAVKYMDACKPFLTMALGARDRSIKTLEDDLIVGLNTRYKKDKRNFSGSIGRMSFAQTLDVARPLQGLRIRPTHATQGIVTINRIQIILNKATTVTVRVYQVPFDSVMGIEMTSFPVTVTSANAYTTVPMTAGPIKLPMTVDSEPVEYYLLYDLSEPGNSPQPKDNAIKCSTCDRGISPFSDFIEVYGVQANDPTMLQDKVIDQYSRGLVLDVDIKCDNEGLFCGQYKENDAIAVVMAWAAWFKSGELLIEEVLKSPDVNRYTTMAREYLWGKRNTFRTEYTTRIEYLVASIDVSASNCYVCRNTVNQPFMAPIYS